MIKKIKDLPRIGATSSPALYKQEYGRANRLFHVPEVEVRALIGRDAAMDSPDEWHELVSKMKIVVVGTENKSPEDLTPVERISIAATQGFRCEAYFSYGRVLMLKTLVPCGIQKIDGKFIVRELPQVL